MMNAFKLGILASAMIAAMAPSVEAACPADGATPFFASPVDPANGFAEYLVDSEGLALQLCLDENFCFFDPPIVGNAFSESIGFGAEAFWWLADTSIATSAGLDALIVMAAEAAFNTAEPAPGEQFPFTRMRIRVDIAVPGIYTVTHPYGQETYVLASAGRRAINDSFDIEFMPNNVNQGRVAPWLTWDTFPDTTNLEPPGGVILDSTNDGVDDFVGDAVTPHAVKGSPCGNNFLRIEAVRLDGVTPINIDPQDQDGDGRTDRVTETLFVVSGRVNPGNAETPLSVDGVTFSRDAVSGRLNVFASAPSTAEVNFDTTIDGVLTAETQVPMSGDGSGRYFGTLPLAPTDPVPTTIEVIAANTAQPNNATAVRTAEVHDIIDVSQADYDAVAKALTVSAASSDMASPPTLTVVGFGDLVGGSAVFETLNVAPATVTVQSSASGTVTVPVRVINP